MGGFEQNPILSRVARLGRAALWVPRETGRMGIFLAKTLTVLLLPPLKIGRFIKRMEFIGFQSLLVIVLTGLFTGMVLSYQSFHTLHRVGSSGFLGPMVALSLLRELGPVIAALMVVARAGSAITAEIGIMRINEEIDALELMGLNPHRYLMLPVLVAAVLCMPLLTAIFNAVGIGGGYLVGVGLLGVGKGVYFGEMEDYVRMSDIWGSCYKALAFGGLIAWVSCYKGYNAGFGSEGVSRSTTQAVVLSSVLILVSDYFLTSFFF
ncbi:MAG: MlaE family ABC transporter permease [Candidatus Brocadiia bacterium]